jgi:hypothetical protein
MREPVLLREVVEELETLMEGWTAYIDRRTGELFSVSEEDAALLEDEPDDDDLPEWQREMITKIREVLESEDWLELPSKFEIHEWAIMEAFSRSIEEPDVRDELLRAIRGSGAFRHFKAAIYRRGIQEHWYQYKTEALERIAADWLDDNGIAYRREGDNLRSAR